MPYCDAFPNAKAGWLDELEQDMTAPDALGYYPPPAHLMSGVEGANAGDAVGGAKSEEDEQGDGKGRETVGDASQESSEGGANFEVDQPL